MTTIKQVEDLKDSEEWDTLSREEKQEHNDKLEEATMYASNRNMLALRTVHTLKFITRDNTK